MRCLRWRPYWSSPVTGVILFFEGENIAYAALTMIALLAGRAPGMLTSLLIVSFVSAANEIIRNGTHL
jgi:hypothetical protein